LGPVDDFKSLGVIESGGSVVDMKIMQLLTNYNGALSVTIFDKNILRNNTLNDFCECCRHDALETAPTMPFVTLGETIFNTNVTNGGLINFVKFAIFEVPLGNGRMSFYAKNQ
jgi:hypothetical protein